jgi:hypothetical protein
MPTLLNRSPFFDKPDEMIFRGDRVLVRANQIILWVSLSLPRFNVVSPEATPFPALLDTGYNHTLAMHERHLNEWARLRLDQLNILSAIHDRDQLVSLRAASLWIHPNVRGLHEKLAQTIPYRIDAKRGIAVYPGSDFPRLPIFGLRAIAENNLVLKVDGAKRRATLQTARTWWPWFAS